jgi:SAM-dependent methyltransferase
METSRENADRVADYDAWYDTARGRWIGETEFALLREMLSPEPDASLIDIGCGTGFFTRLFAKEVRGEVVGIDPDEEALRFARGHAVHGETYREGRAEALPFPDGEFDFGISVAALCFVPDEKQAVREMLRVTRRRFVIGLLNRQSLLWWKKGRGGGSGAYRGAHWHTPGEARALFDGLAIEGLKLTSAIILPGGGRSARWVEQIWPRSWLCGAFLCVSGEIVSAN